MYKKITRLLILVLCSIMLTSCALIPFEDPEDQRKKLEEDALKVEKSPANAAENLESDRDFSRRFTNQAGVTLATYTARMPAFLEEGDNAEVFSALNAHYQAIMDEVSADCDAFFQTVKKRYGIEWDVQTTISGPFMVNYSYEILDTPDEYICINKVYTTTSDAGYVKTSYYPDIFLAENGWKLSFSGLFGSSSISAEKKVFSEIEKWCTEQEVPCEKLSSLGASDFTDYFAMTREHLIFYADPFMLSTNNEKSYEIRLDIELFSDLFVDN